MGTKDRNYSIADRKKAKIEELKQQIVGEQIIVEKSQSIVESLTEKLERIQGQLAEADSDKINALANKDLLNDVIKNVANLVKVSKTVHEQTDAVQIQSDTLLGSTKSLVNELIYAAEMVQKLSILVAKKKALNPMVSDELVHTLGTASADANNAVALVLTTLRSVANSQSAIEGSVSSSTLEYGQSEKLAELVKENNFHTEKNELDSKGIQELIDEAYEFAVAFYNSTLDAYKLTEKQLEDAKFILDKNTVKLQVSEADLEAAKAAV